MHLDPAPAGLVRCDDGVLRCWWSAGDDQYEAYHDDEWGHRVASNDAVFEKLVLETFQSGLSWITILRKREAFRELFADFVPERVAAFTEADKKRLMTDARIVRNRKKIDAAVANAQNFLQLASEVGDVDAWFANYAPVGHERPRSKDQVPAKTDESAALAKELKRRGFSFLGPVTVYAHMQAHGLVNDHIVGCERLP